MRCIEIVFYSVLVNGEKGERFTPTHGFRQGELLSPYSFFIYSEGLSALLRMASTSGSLKGVHINRHVPLITHLLFADDSLIFGEATIEGARPHLKGLGAVNKFWQISSNVSQENRANVCRILRVNSSISLKRYL
ncbi:reverse transcriptase [Gossypium australe]|uniref:Reverse transcriptase n=1 Tax=Gossypium australe TaxID=47621 RepID=A0A5B6V102_9ROSI|nr:reverse transcriptase [Gossypium australe]